MTEMLQMIVGGAVILIGFGCAVSYPGLQYSAVRELRGMWLVLSFLPLMVMLIVGIVTAWALSQGSNLWPIVLIFTAPLATAYLLLLRFIERRMRGGGSQTSVGSSG
jgi:hypothetical protein